MEANDASVDTLMRFYDEGRQGGGFEAGIQQALARLLIDPQFLYRMESEPDGLAAGESYRISDLELASRLSFFLWSSIPDEKLLELAAREAAAAIRAVLEQQVRRMLADPRSNALVENFAGQWLHLRELRHAQPHDRGFDDNLRRAFGRRPQMLFAQRRCARIAASLDLLDADYTFVNERLARHYGMAGVHGSYMRRVSLARRQPARAGCWARAAS